MAFTPPTMLLLLLLLLLSPPQLLLLLHNLGMQAASTAAADDGEPNCALDAALGKKVWARESAAASSARTLRNDSDGM
jgi:hypothetical protein